MARTSTNSSAANLTWATTNVLAGAATATWSFWLRVDAWNAAFQTFWAKDDYPTQAAAWGFQRVNTTDNITYFERGGGGTRSVDYGGFTPSSSWVHLAAFRRASDGMLRLYKAGVGVGDATCGLNPFGNTASAMTMGVDNTHAAVAEMTIYLDATLAQADAIAASLAASGNPLNQAVRPSFYAPLASYDGTEGDVIGTLPAIAAAGNSSQVAGPSRAPFGVAYGSILVVP